MDELSHLQNGISDLTRILSLITRRVPDVEEKDSELPHSDDCEIGLETEDVRMDEAEFDSPFASAEINAIKRTTLDRLAEALARFKTAKGSQVRNKQHSDAKHVTSVIMVEDSGGKSITFLCAKNEGLDALDLGFLAKLEDLLRNIATNGKRNPFI